MNEPEEYYDWSQGEMAGLRERIAAFEGWFAGREYRVHDIDCRRYIKGLVFTQPSECTCGLHALLHPATQPTEGA